MENKHLNAPASGSVASDDEDDDLDLRAVGELSTLDDSALQDGDDSDEEALLSTKPKLAFYSGQSARWVVAF
jgi:hypothetical protein